MKKPKLIILGGFAGAGKTTIAKKLASEFNFPIFSSDEFNDGLRPLLGKDFHETSPVAYELLWFLLKINMSNKVTSILDMNMCSDRSWQTIDQLKKEFPDTEFLSMILECSLDTHKERVKLRGTTNKTHLNLGGDSLPDIMYKYDYINNLRRSDLIRIDANGSIEATYDSVVKEIDEQT